MTRSRHARSQPLDGEVEHAGSDYLPDVYTRFEHRFPAVHVAHQELARACYEGGPLDARCARLVKLGIAIGAQAEGAVRSHARRALAEGLTEDEIFGLFDVKVRPKRKAA